MVIQWLKKINISQCLLAGILLAPILAVCPIIFDSYDFAKISGLIFFCLAYALTGFWLARKNGCSISLNISDIFPLAIIVSFGISALLSIDKILSALGSFGAVSQWDLGIIGKFSQGFIALIFFVLVYFIFSRVNLSEIPVKKLFIWLLSGQSICLAIFYCTLFGLIGPGYFPLLPGVFKQITGFINIASPIGWGVVQFSIFCSIVSAICFYCIGRYFSEDKKIRYWAIAILCLQLPVWYLAKFWPNNILIFLEAIIALGIFGWRNHRVAKIIFLLALILPIIMFAPQATNSIYKNFKANVLGEPILPLSQSLQVAINSLASSPKNLLVGTGPGTYAINYLLYRGATINKELFWSVRFQESGSYLTELASTVGLLGLAIFKIFICYFCYLAFFKGGKNKEALGLGLIFFAISISLAIYHSSVWQMVLLFAVAGLISQVSSSAELFKTKDLVWLNRIFIVLTVTVFATSLYYLANFFLADKAYLDALNSPTEKEVAGNVNFAVSHNKYSELYWYSLGKANYLELYNLAKDPKASQDKELMSGAIVKVNEAVNKSTLYFPQRGVVWVQKDLFLGSYLPLSPKLSW